MANRPNIIREMVSGQRIRYTEDGFNLDLSYITDNIIAMGFPAENMEAIYRNKREDVLKFLNEKHGKKYKVYNLCAERAYIGDILFPHYSQYPFKDHNPPDIELINQFCKDVHNFLSSDRSHVVAIHCKAGKGRTGTMICCYLLYSNTFQTADEALKYYAEKRTKDKKGVTIPSQRRYVQYYEQLLRDNLKYKEVSLYILELRISPADVPLKSGSIKLKGTKDSLPLVDFQRSGDYILFVLDRCMPLKGDVKVEFGRTKLDKGWHFWFNTFFVERAANYDSQGRLVLTLDKLEIDDAHKGNARKCPEQVQVFLKPSGKYSECLDARRKLPPLPQPLADGNQQLYAMPNNHHQLHYQQQQQAGQQQQQQQQQQPQQRHHATALRDPSNHNQSLVPNYNDVAQQQQHQAVVNNNRASLVNSQQNSSIYSNITMNPPDVDRQQQQQLNHSGGSSEEISGTDSVEDEEEGEEGWESGECQTVVSETMCKSRTTATTTANTTTATIATVTNTTTTSTTPYTKSYTNQTSSSSSSSSCAVLRFSSVPPVALPETAPGDTRTTTSLSSPSSAARRCISDNENYLLTRSSCGLIRKGSNSSSVQQDVENREYCSSVKPSTNNNHNNTAADSQALFKHPVSPDAGSSLAVLLYDAKSLPYGYDAAGGLQESHTLLAPSSPSIDERPTAVGLGTVGLPVDGSGALGIGAGAASGKAEGSKLSSSTSASTSPFRRFGLVAMGRKKKRSLKLKHTGATGGSGTGGGLGGGGAGSALYGSCASNLSGISIGNGSAKGGVAAVAAAATTADGKGGGMRTKLKFRWLRNMRSDPNLKETLAKNVVVRGVSTAPIVVSVAKGHAATTTTTTTSACVTIPKSPTVASKMPIPIGLVEPMVAPAVGSRKAAAGAGNIIPTTTPLPTDYYSFLCDNQLSYESPSKSPGHLMRLEQALARRPSTIEEQVASPPPTPITLLPQPSPPVTTPPSPTAAITVSGSSSDCSVVKPRADNVKIGFNISPPPSSPAIDATTGEPSLESSFEIIHKCDAVPFESTSVEQRATDGFCNKLIHHIVSSVGRGAVEEAGPSLAIRRSSSSSSSSLAAARESPVLARSSNRCAPFSFRDLRAAMKIPIPKHRSQATASSSSSSSSSSNLASGGGGGIGGGSSTGCGDGGVSSAVRSIERTLSAPVAVQTLDCSVLSADAANSSTIATISSPTGPPVPPRALNRSLSDRQLGGCDDHRSERRSGH